MLLYSTLLPTRNRDRVPSHSTCTKWDRCRKFAPPYGLVNPATGHACGGLDLFETKKGSELLSHVHFLSNKAGCSASLGGLVRAIEDCSGSPGLKIYIPQNCRMGTTAIDSGAARVSSNYRMAVTVFHYGNWRGSPYISGGKSLSATSLQPGNFLSAARTALESSPS